MQNNNSSHHFLIFFSSYDACWRSGRWVTSVNKRGVKKSIRVTSFQQFKRGIFYSPSWIPLRLLHTCKILQYWSGSNVLVLISGKSYHFFKWKFPSENTEHHIIQLNIYQQSYIIESKVKPTWMRVEKRRKNTPKISRWIETNEFNILFSDSLTFVSICRCVCTCLCFVLTHWTNWHNKNVISTKWNRKFLLLAPFSDTLAFYSFFEKCVISATKWFHSLFYL